MHARTQGGDDLVGVDLNDGVDDDMVVADDRDVQVSLGMSNAWLTLDNLLANFVDPINADRGSLVSLFSETTRLANQQSMEQTWQWSWCTTEQQETMDRIRDARAAKKAAAGTSEATTEDAPAELESPVEAGEEESIPEMPTFTTELVTPTTEGAWMRMPSEWGPRQVLHFPSDDDLVKEASDGAAESDEPPAAAAEAASEEAAASVPKLDTKCLQTRTFVVTLSNHLSMPSRFPKSIARIALREIGGNGAVHRIETSTITSSRFEYMGDTATFEVDLDAPAGASVTFSSDNEVRLLDHAVHAKNVLKRPHAYSVSGITKASGADDLQVAFRCHFNVPQATPAASDVEDGEAQAGADSGTGETSVSAGAVIDADLCVSDPLLRKYVHMLIVNEDTGEQTAVPLNRFRAQSFLPNRDGYTLMAFVHRRDGMLPPSNWRLTVSSSSPAEAITEFTQHTLNSVQDFSGAYIPNKYFRILRDVITASEPSEEDAEEAEENAIPKKPCPYTSVRFKVSFRSILLLWEFWQGLFFVVEKLRPESQGCS